MVFLAFETSTETASVALLRDQQLLAEVVVHARARQTELLIDMVDDVLRYAGVELEEVRALGVSIGPGSFTGLRVGVATAKALAFDSERSVYPVCSLRALAAGCATGHGVAVAVLPAYGGEIYGAAYAFGASGELEVELVGPVSGSPDVVVETLRSAVAGHKVSVCGAALRLAGVRELCASLGVCAPATFDVPRASHVAQQASYLAAQQPPCAVDSLEPLYLRLPAICSM